MLKICPNVTVLDDGSSETVPKSGSFAHETAKNMSSEKADSRMRSHARARGYEITHLSRPVQKKDFEKFDYIVGMDDQNIRALNHMTSSGEEQAKIIKMTDFLQKLQAVSVPDPYYEGDAGFVKVIDLLEDACEGLFRHLQIKDFGNK